MVKHQCDQIGRCFKVLVTNFLTKVGKIFEDLLGYIEINCFLGKNAVDTFWTTLRRIWLLFIPPSGHTVKLCYLVMTISFV